MSSPWTGIGSLQNDISLLQSELHRKADSHEVTSLVSRLARLECSLEELSTENDGLRARIETLESTCQQYGVE
jgi:hypothetical protein